MQLGEKNQSVGILQGDLTSIGIQTTRDNCYGPSTVKSVKQFQNENGLLVDGEAGPLTLSKLAQVKGNQTKVVNKTFGLDVSAWQPNTDWNAVAKGGAKFAFVKATEGLTYVSPTFKKDYAAAKAAGLIVGSYHFFKPNISGAQQANHYATTVLDLFKDEDLPLVLDFEVAGKSAATDMTEILAFLKVLEQTTKKTPILYTNPAMLTYLKNVTALGSYPLWIAAPERESAPIIQPWGLKWTFWQYTFKGKFTGTTGQDGNYFNGSLDDLKKFANTTLRTPPATPQPKPQAVVAATDAPWMTFMEAHEGLNEANNSRQLADLIWPHTNYTAAQKAHTVVGDKYAWCAATVNAALEISGYKGNKSAQAQSFETFGQACDFKFGAILPIRHANGTHHATFFHHWVDKTKNLAACLGGNQSNALKISTYNLSGNSKGCDQVTPGPRWPINKA